MKHLYDMLPSQRADGYRSARLREAAAAGGLSEVETKQREDKVRDLLRKQCAEMLSQMGRGHGRDEAGNVLEAKDFEAYKRCDCAQCLRLLLHIFFGHANSVGWFLQHL